MDARDEYDYLFKVRVASRSRALRSEASTFVAARRATCVVRTRPALMQIVLIGDSGVGKRWARPRGYCCRRCPRRRSVRRAPTSGVLSVRVCLGARSNLLSRFTKNEFNLESKSTIGVEVRTPPWDWRAQ